MMAYPNRTHSIREGANTTRHLRELLTRYLIEHVPAGPHGKAKPKAERKKGKRKGKEKERGKKRSRSARSRSAQVS